MVNLCSDGSPIAEYHEDDLIGRAMRSETQIVVHRIDCSQIPAATLQYAPSMEPVPRLVQSLVPGETAVTSVPKADAART